MEGLGLRVSEEGLVTPSRTQSCVVGKKRLDYPILSLALLLPHAQTLLGSIRPKHEPKENDRIHSCSTPVILLISGITVVIEWCWS